MLKQREVAEDKARLKLMSLKHMVKVDPTKWIDKWVDYEKFINEWATPIVIEPLFSQFVLEVKRHSEAVMKGMNASKLFEHQGADSVQRL